MGDWVPYATLITIVLGVVYSVFVKAPIVRKSQLQDVLQTNSELRKDIEGLRAEIISLRAEVVQLTAENQRLLGRIRDLLEDNEYWRGKYQKSDRKE